MSLVADLGHDFVLAARQLRRERALTLLVMVTLVVGIGANLTLVGAVRSLLFSSPPGVGEPSRVGRLLIAGTSGASPMHGGANYPRLLDLQHQAPAFESLASVALRMLSTAKGPTAVELKAQIVSSNFFHVLGASPLFGRTFSPTDGFPSVTSTGGPPLTVLSHDFWVGRLAGDTAALGRQLTVGAISYTIIGVMPPGFRGIESTVPDVWLPVTVAAADPDARIDLADRARYSMHIIGRLRPGIAFERAERQATKVWRESDIAIPGVTQRDSTQVAFSPLDRGRSVDVPREARVTVWLAGASIVILLLACANVANILLSRSIARKHEIAVRLALGATPYRVVRQLVSHAGLLSVLSAGIALGFAAFFGPVLIRLLTGLDGGRFVDPAMVAISILVAFGTGALVSLTSLPLVLSSDQRSALQEPAGRSGRDARQTRLGLLAAQSAMCMVLLVVASWFTTSLRNISTLDLGIDEAHTLRALVNLDGVLASSDIVTATYDEMLRAVRGIPGVTAAAIASSDPYSAGRAVAPHTRSGSADLYWPPARRDVAIEAAVGDAFFSAVGARSLRGRDFRPSDTRAAPQVAIINEPLAHILFPNADPLGDCIIIPTRAGDRSSLCVTVVGVLSGVWYSRITDRDKPMVFIPIAQRVGYDGVWRPQGVFVRTASNPRYVAEEVRRRLQAVRTDLPAVRLSIVADAVASETRPWRIGTFMFGLFGIVALIVAAVGLFAVVSLAVSERSFELAVRRAIGATNRDIVLTTAKGPLIAVLSGLFIGALASLVAGRWLSQILYETSPSDPTTLFGVAAVMIAAAAVALFGPLTHALRSDPSMALRGN